MKVFLANSSKQAIGGGWSFIANLRKSISGVVTENYDEADIYFIPSPTMVQRDEVQQAKNQGKKVVLRVDNAVRNSRNRNTGMSRMKDFATWADLVIYQSQWARDYLRPFLKVDGPVILNSADESIFNTQNRKSDENTFLYSRFNRDETKGFEIARYWYSQQQRKNPNSRLLIVGQYSQELIDGNFDFYMNEDYQYLGVVQDPYYMAAIYKQADYLIYPYFKDACSNTLIESKLCGCEITSSPFFLEGSAEEILAKPNNYFHLDRMGREYERCLRAVV